jgi:hypothetical protein
MNYKILTAIIASTLALAITARASEGGSTAYTPGSYSDFTGMPPTQPGFYIGNSFLDYGNGEFSASRQLPLNGILAAGLTVNSQTESPSVSYAYPFSLYNITFSSGIAPSYVWMDVKATATFDRNGNPISGSKEQSASGVGDLELTPIMAAWTNGDFIVGGIFNVYAPTGNFDTDSLASPGLGYWTFEPMLAFSWFSSKIGTEFTVFTAVDFNTENTTTDYQSGDIFHVDATLAQHLPLFGGTVGAGASAFYLKQFTGDSGSGARLGSFETETVGVGPTVSYIHNIGRMELIVDGSWLPQLKAVNTSKGNYFWARISLSF